MPYKEEHMQCPFDKIDEILKKHSFSTEDDILKNADLILKDMNAGLTKEDSSSLAMLHTNFKLTSIDINKIKSSKKIIALDLGGSNLRSCLISFDEDIVKFDKLKKEECKKEYQTCDEFFAFIAESIEMLKDDSSYIVFCFSYALEFLKTGEAIVAGLSKDLSVPNIKNKNVGVELLKALKIQGWKDDVTIFVTNDTVATLCSGLYNNVAHRKNNLPSSFMSIILGTGLNVAYFDANEDDVIILEAGAFDKIKRSNFDEKVVMKSRESNHHIMEKQCSAHYLGSIAKEIFKSLLEDDVFSKDFKLIVKSRLESFEDWVVLNNLISTPYKDNLKFIDVSLSKDDFEVLHYVIRKLVLRTANLISALIVAVALKMKNENIEKLFTVVEGSTILKTQDLFDLVKQEVGKCLKKIEGVEVEFITSCHATLLGSAVFFGMSI